MITLWTRPNAWCKASPERPKTAEERLNNIMKVISEASGYSANEIKSSSRETTIKTWRQIGMYYAATNRITSLRKIGLFFGGRDHSTTLHARDIISDLIDCNDFIVMEKWNKVKNILV